ncbi:MAG TPA: radical SAM protein, partial [Blastocatellia bacterium]|nr:radical SAM protein [Blastocatellia bacterium]
MQLTDETGDDLGSGTLMLHLLGRCNLECQHCYMEGSPFRKEELPLDAVLGAVAECKLLGIGTVYITGGEPLLYRGLDDVIRAAAEIPKLQIALCTNGTSITPRRAAFFGSLGLRSNISIDGDEAFHDHFRRQPGAFRASERGVRMMADAGVPVTIIATISQANLHLLPAIVEWTAQSGAVRLLVQPLLKLGRGTGIADQRLSTSQMNLLFLRLSDLANRLRSSDGGVDKGLEKGLGNGLDCKLIGANPKFLKAHPCGAYVCNGGGCHRRVAKEIKKLVIREDGTVLPEVPNLNHRYALGNIQDGALSTLVRRYFENGYEQFDLLCRTAYAEVLPTWEAPVVPWEQIIAERSEYWSPRQASICTGIPGDAVPA